MFSGLLEKVLAGPVVEYVPMGQRP